MMSDPLADMLTRVRNAARIERSIVDMPASRLKVGVAEVLKTEGYVYDYQVGQEVPDEHGIPHLQPAEGKVEGKATLRIFLKYGPDGERVIRHLERISKPGCRIYASVDKLPRVLAGMGIAIVSTSKGVMSDRSCRGANVGGEILCTVS